LEDEWEDGRDDDMYSEDFLGAPLYRLDWQRWACIGLAQRVMSNAIDLPV